MQYTPKTTMMIRHDNEKKSSKTVVTLQTFGELYAKEQLETGGVPKSCLWSFHRLLHNLKDPKPSEETPFHPKRETFGGPGAVKPPNPPSEKQVPLGGGLPLKRAKKAKIFFGPPSAARRIYPKKISGRLRRPDQVPLGRDQVPYRT